MAVTVPVVVADRVDQVLEVAARAEVMALVVPARVVVMEVVAVRVAVTVPVVVADREAQVAEALMAAD